MLSITNKRRLIPLSIFGLALGMYWGTAVWGGNTHGTPYVIFDQLADSFLHGHLYLVNPPSTHDLTLYKGQWYAPYPPLAALLMLPWVAVFGPARTNGIFFSILFGAANVPIVYALLQELAAKQWTRLSTTDNLWLTALFGLGSLHWYMATVGNVYFIAQTVAITFVALAVWAAVKGKFWLAGSMLALAVLSRPHVIFTWPLIIGIAAEGSAKLGKRLDWNGLRRAVLKSAVPLVISLILLLSYNVARFRNPFDFGYLTANVAPEFSADLNKYGLFDIHYVPRNVWAMLLAGFRWEPKCSLPVPDPYGMSLFLTTPALIYMFAARRRTPIVYGAWISLGLVLISVVTYYNTGFFQFGYRFSLDFTVPMIALLALGAESKVSWAMRILIIVGVLVNACGVAWWYKYWCP